MRKQTLFFGLLLGSLLFGACDPDEDSSSSKNNSNDPNSPNTLSSNALSLLKNYKTQYKKEKGEAEYKSNEWMGNTLKYYNPAGKVWKEITFDDKGRQIKLVYYDYRKDPAKPTKDTTTYTYRYEGKGNSYRLYDKVHTTEGNNKEYKSSEWVGNTLKYYNSAGKVFIEDTYDDKGRIIKSTDNDKKSSYTHRYEGDGPEEAAFAITGRSAVTSLNTYKYTIQYNTTGKEYKSSEWEDNTLKFYQADGTTLAEKTTYDAEGRITEFVEADGIALNGKVTYSTITYRYE